MKRQGYTIVELLAVLAVLSILAMSALPLAEIAAQRQKEQALRQALMEIRSALDAYKRAVDAGLVPPQAYGSGYPPTLMALVSGVRSEDGRVMHFLRRLPRDPFAPDGVPAEASWGLRSYESPPEAPRPGADVFDVYSNSARIGSNGVPLREW